jgi:hypothetical protein
MKELLLLMVTLIVIGFSFSYVTKELSNTQETMEMILLGAP